MSVEKHVHLIALLWIVMGAISFVSGLLLFGFLFGISLIPDMGSEAPIILRLLGSGIGFFLWLFSLPKIICGFGLISHREWARVLTLVLSFFSLLNIPLGTALGVYSLVILTKEETSRYFRTS
jgi:hypothetical protein